jgi:hypothetical protein
MWRHVVCSACHLLTCWFLLKFSSTLKMEAICSSETSVASQDTTRRHIPEDDTLHLRNAVTILYRQNRFWTLATLQQSLNLSWPIHLMRLLQYFIPIQYLRSIGSVRSGQFQHPRWWINVHHMITWLNITSCYTCSSRTELSHLSRLKSLHVSSPVSGEESLSLHKLEIDISSLIINFRRKYVAIVYWKFYIVLHDWWETRLE